MGCFLMIWYIICVSIALLLALYGLITADDELSDAHKRALDKLWSNKNEND
jgi:hypothetical protein